MTEEDRTAFYTALAEVASVHHRRLEGHVYALYFEALEDFPWPPVRRALKESIKHCKRFPTPAEIRPNVRTFDAPRARAPHNVPRLEGPPANPKHAKEAFALIQKIMGRQITVEQRLAAFKARAKKYPGFGWETAVESLEVPF